MVPSVLSSSLTNAWVAAGARRGYLTRRRANFHSPARWVHRHNSNNSRSNSSSNNTSNIDTIKNSSSNNNSTVYHRSNGSNN